MRNVLLLGFALLVVGCQEATEADTPVAEPSSGPMIKTAEGLPKNMPEEARASASSAMAQGAAAQAAANDPARVNAMNEMKKQHP